MADYKNMYKSLFVSVSQAIEILQKAQIEAEELYIKSSESETILFDDGLKKDEDSQSFNKDE